MELQAIEQGTIILRVLKNSTISFIILTKVLYILRLIGSLISIL
jgi:hypothetical protein